MSYKVQGLPSFPELNGLPQNGEAKLRALHSPVVKSVVCFCLGPEGTNIEQAAKRWIDRMGITYKARVVLCLTPEDSLRQAREVTEEGVLAVFWTCAVYAKEAEFFFTNPDILTFYFNEVMNLDAMQLATRPEMGSQLIPNADGDVIIPSSWLIASHPSPQHLVKPLGCEVVLVNSNAAAAEHCAKRLSAACITTETARKIHGLVTIHMFNSPPMVFFGGITAAGAALHKKASLRK